jgi:hypothetical protein
MGEDRKKSHFFNSTEKMQLIIFFTEPSYSDEVTSLFF